MATLHVNGYPLLCKRISAQEAPRVAPFPLAVFDLEDPSGIAGSALRRAKKSWLECEFKLAMNGGTLSFSGYVRNVAVRRKSINLKVEVSSDPEMLSDTKTTTPQPEGQGAGGQGA